MAVVIVVASIASLKVALMVLLLHTVVERSTGFRRVTVGAVVSVLVPVVKVHGFGIAPAANALPATSLAPVVIVAVYLVLAARVAGDVGVKVAVLLATA